MDRNNIPYFRRKQQAQDAALSGELKDIRSESPPATTLSRRVSVYPTLKKYLVTTIRLLTWLLVCIGALAFIYDRTDNVHARTMQALQVLSSTTNYGPAEAEALKYLIRSDCLGFEQFDWFNPQMIGRDDSWQQHVRSGLRKLLCVRTRQRLYDLHIGNQDFTTLFDYDTWLYPWFERSSFINPIFSRMEVRYGYFYHSSFKNANFEFVNFFDTNLANTSFEEATLVGIDFISDVPVLKQFREEKKDTNAENIHYELDMLRLNNTAFTQSHLSSVRFKNAYLERSRFADSQLWDVSFTDSELTSSHFDHSELNNVRFQDSNLSWASFRQSKITVTNRNATKIFAGTDLTHTDFTQTDWAAEFYQSDKDLYLYDTIREHNQEAIDLICLALRQGKNWQQSLRNQMFTCSQP
ncbi:pentapeptide repeat-containing protein [Vibrio mangrovi]|uniref:Pentapeptide repeat-containing protein n=1 Tax=Vibrio mangrovi TaxID=474394 RepID=A0A1Y6J055_9VIBR|nr:pentapeptide repeat-containing protein [Vibrio mangrovi]MDW6005437.1 pentapeptide repeat-containing protein [Vibrio mangrovi]SMS02122.1 Pentapeptide repeats (8 copies) [Vibrio mangrovi]